MFITTKQLISFIKKHLESEDQIWNHYGFNSIDNPLKKSYRGEIYTSIFGIQFILSKNRNLKTRLMIHSYVSSFLQEV